MSRIIKALLFAALLTPLIYTPSLLFPFVFGKVVFFRVIVELALVAFLAYCFEKWRKGSGAGETSRTPLMRHPLVALVALFAFFFALSTFFAVNGYRSFWSDIERGGGLFGLLHLVAFLLLSVVFFSPRDWLRFFEGSLVVGAVVAIYGWFQYFGVTNMFFALPAATQPGSFLGNPAYLAGYLILLAGVAFVVGARAPVGWWRKASPFFAAFFFLTLFIAQIRGALLGAAAGIVFFLLYLLFSRFPDGSPSRLLKRTAAIILLLMIGGSVLLFTTRTAPVWQSIPGVARFAKESFDISSVATRILALGVSWNAFKERPLFGWGPENFNVAYNTHYDPSYAYYAEDWFDRAHNQVAEAAVTGGIGGLLTYLGLYAGLIVVVFKHLPVPEGEEKRRAFFLRPLLAATVIAYFVQNLFLFDTPSSSLILFALIGFLVSETRALTHPWYVTLPLPARRIAAWTGGALLLIGAGAGFYFGNAVPYSQAKTYVVAVRTKVGEKIHAATEEFLVPHSFAQTTIRAQLSDLIYENGLFRALQFRALTDRVLAALEEDVAREPYEPRQFIRIVEGYEEYAKADHAFFVQAEEYARRALALSPNRQGIRYHVAFVLAGAGKYEEAIALAEESVTLDPRVYKSQYQLGIVYSLYADAPGNKGTPRQTEYRAKAGAQFTKAWEMAKEQNQFGFFLTQDMNNLIVIYRILGEVARAAEVVDVALRLYPREEAFYVSAMAIYRDLRQKDRIIDAARKLKELNPAHTNDADTIIDLAEKENWLILDTL